MAVIKNFIYLLFAILLFGCQHSLTPGEITRVRATSKNIQADDRQERREFLQDRKDFELSNEGYSDNNVIILR